MPTINSNIIKDLKICFISNPGTQNSANTWENKALEQLLNHKFALLLVERHKEGRGKKILIFQLVIECLQKSNQGEMTLVSPAGCFIKHAIWNYHIPS